MFSPNFESRVICSLIDCYVNFGVKLEITFVNFVFYSTSTSLLQYYLVLINSTADIRKTSFIYNYIN